MDEIRWEDPPTTQAGRPGRWVELLIPLMDHPKRWAIVEMCSSSEKARRNVKSLKTGKLKSPSGRWEFTSSTVDDEHRIYARYLGPDEDVS
jgi:hypothetical protein